MVGKLDCWVESSREGWVVRRREGLGITSGWEDPCILAGEGI